MLGLSPSQPKDFTLGIVVPTLRKKREGWGTRSFVFGAYLAKIILAGWWWAMREATMFEAKTRLSELVRRAQRGEKIIQNNVPLLSTDARMDAFGVRRMKKTKR